MEYSSSEVLQYVSENDVKFIKLFFADIFGEIKSISVQPSVLKGAFKEGISLDANAVKGFLAGLSAPCGRPLGLAPFPAGEIFLENSVGGIGRRRRRTQGAC